MTSNRQGVRSIGTNAFLLFASQTLTAILRAVYAIVVARMLGPELYGLFYYGLGWYASFLAVANLYLEAYMSRMVSLHPGDRETILSQALTLRTFSVALAFAAALLAIGAGETDADISKLLFIFAMAMIGRSAAMWCASAFVASEKARYAFQSEVIFRILEIIFGILLLLADFGIHALALIHAVSWWAQAIYAYLLVHEHLGTVRFRAIREELIHLLRIVMPVAIGSISLTWLMQGPLVIFRHIGDSLFQLGQVALALQVFILISNIPTAVGRAALPVLTRAVKRSDQKDSLFLGVILRVSFVGTGLIAFGLMAFGDWLLPLIFGEKYKIAGGYVGYAAWLILPFGLGQTINQLLLAHDLRKQAMISAATGALSMTLLLLQYPSLDAGPEVYFFGVFAGMTVWAALALFYVSREVPVLWFRYLASPGVAVASALGVFIWLSGTAAGSLLSLLTSVTVLLILTILLGVVSRSEFRSIFGILKAIRARS